MKAFEARLWNLREGGGDMILCVWWSIFRWCCLCVGLLMCLSVGVYLYSKGMSVYLSRSPSLFLSTQRKKQTKHKPYIQRQPKERKNTENRKTTRKNLKPSERLLKHLQKDH